MTRNGTGERVQFPPFLAVVLLRLVQVAAKNVRVKRKENAGNRHEAFPGKIKKVKNQRKWKKSATAQKIYHFKSGRPI